MQFEISDPAALVFSQSFYQAIARRPSGRRGHGRGANGDVRRGQRGRVGHPGALPALTRWPRLHHGPDPDADRQAREDADRQARRTPTGTPARRTAGTLRHREDADGRPPPPPETIAPPTDSRLPVPPSRLARTLTGHTKLGRRCGVQPGRAAARHRQRGPDGAGVGPGHRRAPAHPDRPHRAGSRVWRSARTGSCSPPPADDKTVRLWDPATGHRLRTLTGHTDGVNAVAFSPDGHPARHRQRRRDGAAVGPGHRRQHLRTLTGHTDRGDGVAFSPDGQLLATAGDDETVRLWDPATGDRPAHPHRPHRRVRRVAFSPDGQPARHRQRATRRCGCGTRPPASTCAPSPATPTACRRRGVQPGRARCSPPPATTGRCGCGTRPPAAPAHPHRPHRRG